MVSSRFLQLTDSFGINELKLEMRFSLWQLSVHCTCIAFVTFSGVAIALLMLFLHGIYAPI